MKRFYDKKNKRLIFVGQGATADFWDKQWGDNFVKEVKDVSDDTLVVKTTKRFLPSPAKILEGGCGRGQYVYALKRNGYNAYGVDYAKETIEQINKSFPDLKVYLGDVRRLSFADNEFDGYWSLGVIEHFYDGYGDILKEAVRILKPGGFLFLSFPVMSPFRRLKSFLGFYPRFIEKEFDKNSFYQFALPYKKVVLNLENAGLKMVFKKYNNGFKVFKDETIVGGLVSKNRFLSRVFKKIINPLSFFFGNTLLLVAEKNNEQ